MRKLLVFLTLTVLLIGAPLALAQGPDGFTQEVSNSGGDATIFAPEDWFVSLDEYNGTLEIYLTSPADGGPNTTAQFVPAAALAAVGLEDSTPETLAPRYMVQLNYSYDYTDNQEYGEVSTLSVANTTAAQLRFSASDDDGSYGSEGFAGIVAVDGGFVKYTTEIEHYGESVDTDLLNSENITALAILATLQVSGDAFDGGFLDGLPSDTMDIPAGWFIDIFGDSAFISNNTGYDFTVNIQAISDDVFDEAEINASADDDAETILGALVAFLSEISELEEDINFEVGDITTTDANGIIYTELTLLVQENASSDNPTNFRGAYGVFTNTDGTRYLYIASIGGTNAEAEYQRYMEHARPLMASIEYDVEEAQPTETSE